MTNFPCHSHTRNQNPCPKKRLLTKDKRIIPTRDRTAIRIQKRGRQYHILTIPQIPQMSSNIPPPIVSPCQPLTSIWTHIWGGCLVIEFMIGTPEGQIPNTENLDNDASLPNLSYCCGLHHFNLNSIRGQSFLQHRGESKCRLVDPIGNVDPHLSMTGIVQPCVYGKFGHQTKKTLCIVGKCNFNDIWWGLNKAVTTQMHAIFVSSIIFHKFPLAGEHFNFLGFVWAHTRIAFPAYWSRSWKLLQGRFTKHSRAHSQQFCFWKRSQQQSVSFGQPRQQYCELLSTVLKESNMTMDHKNSCFQLYMRGKELLR